MAEEHPAIQNLRSALRYYGRSNGVDEQRVERFIEAAFEVIDEELQEWTGGSSS